MQNPSDESSNPTTKSPSSSPVQPPPPPSGLAQAAAATVEGGSSAGGIASSGARIFQVADPDTGGDRPQVGEAVGEGGSSAVAVCVEGGVVVDGGSAMASTPERQGKQKRKSSQLSDPPPWPPKCNECGKEFPSWKAAFGHMRAHPNRDYRGFFKPPTSSSPSSSPIRQRVHQEVAGENVSAGVEQHGGEKGASSATGGVGFDLNEPMKEEMKSSSSEVAERNEAPDSSSSTVAVEEKKVGFDLNELPPSEDDGQHKP